jgi:peroxiredoxin
MGLLAITTALMGGCASSSSASSSTSSSGSTAAKTTSAPEVTLQGESASAVPLNDLVTKKPLTVLLFFTAECPVQKAHDVRFREIVTTYEGKGVSFALISSDAGGDINAEREDAKRRALPPLYADKDAALADALGVEYSTHAIVLDSQRHVLYSGAVDADKTHMKEASERYLKNALDDALAGRPIRKTKTEALGCPLRKH